VELTVRLAPKPLMWMGAKTVELDSSHVPMMSKPQAVIEVILDAANAVSSRKG